MSKTKPLLRKTFKHSDQENNTLNSKQQAAEISFRNGAMNTNSIETSFSLQTGQSTIEPSSQIEKSKKTANHYEDLIRKILSEKYSENLIKPVSSSDLAKIDDLEESPFNGLENKILPNDEADLNEGLESKLSNLAENEKKLE